MVSLLSSCRIVCEMGEAKPSQHAGFVEICVAVCRPEFMARSSQLYYFMVSPGHKKSHDHHCWAPLDLWANAGSLCEPLKFMGALSHSEQIITCEVCKTQTQIQTQLCLAVALQVS